MVCPIIKELQISSLLPLIFREKVKKIIWTKASQSKEKTKPPLSAPLFPKSPNYYNHQNSPQKHITTQEIRLYLSLILLLLRCSVTECLDLIALALSLFFPSIPHKETSCHDCHPKTTNPNS